MNEWEDIDESDPLFNSEWEDIDESDPLLNRGTEVSQQIDPEPPSFAASVGRGLTDIQQGMNQGYLFWKSVVTGDTSERDEFQEEANAELDLYKRGQGEGFDAGRTLGQIVGTLPLSLGPRAATLAGKTAYGALEGGLGAAATYSEGGAGETIDKFGVGLIAGGLGPAILKGTSQLGGGAYKAVRNAISRGRGEKIIKEAIDEIPIPTTAATRNAASQQLAQTGFVQPDILRRQAELAQLGFKGDSAPLTGQLTRSPQLFSAEQNLAKLDDIGEPIVNRLQAQTDQFNVLGKGVKNRIGGSGTGVGQSEYVGQRAVDAIKGRYESTQKTVGRLYSQARKKYGDVEGVGAESLIDKVTQLSDDVSLDPVTNSVLNRVKRLGLIDDEGLTGGTITVGQAEGLRKFINGLSNQGSARYAKRQIIEALDDDVFNTIGDDGFATARAAARDRFTEFENKLVSKVIKGSIQPNQIVNSIKTASTRELNDLRNTLQSAGAKGNQAWKDLRSQFFDELWVKSGGKEGLTAQFGKELDKIGDKKLRVLFPDSFDQLKVMRKAADDLNVAPRQNSINRSNTAPTLRNYANNLPYIGGIIKDNSLRKAVGLALEGGVIDPSLAAARSMAPAESILNAIYSKGPLPSIGNVAPAAAGVTAYGLLNTP